MRIFLLIFSSLLMQFSFQDTALAEYDTKLCNPKPSEGDLILPGPNNTCFTFRPIYIEATSPFDGITFLMGDVDSDSFRTPPTKVMLSGSFADEEKENLWLFYLGKYEITRAQYRAVMGNLPKNFEGKEIKKEEENFPITNLSYFESIAFMDALNQWLYANAEDDLPYSGNYPAFVRLPTEIEWEFAARGGTAVEKTLFEAPMPYESKIQEYEWFAGPSSSHGKMKEIGLLKPNPLGLHDILGNVQEITSSLYQLEYYQGRSGGFVSRGGSFLMEEDRLHVALRQEEPYYLKRRNGLSANAKLTLGLRLALSAPLLTDRDAIADLEDTWEEYRSGAGSTTPAALSVAPVSDQENVSMNDALARIAKLRSLPQEEATKILSQELAYAESVLKTTAKAREKADADAAKVWLAQAMFLGQEMQQQMVRFLSFEERVKAKAGQDDLPVWQKRLDDVSYIINKVLERYRDSVASLDNLPSHLVKESFEERKKEEEIKLNTQELSKEDIGRALAALALVQSHYEQFNKSKRADILLWKENFKTNVIK